MTRSSSGGALPGPGLNVDALRAVRGRRRGQGHDVVLQRIEAHLQAYDGYVAVSGGKDSVVVADLARRVDPAVPLVWFDSGLEYPETLPYLHELRDRWGANLHIVPASPTLLELLVASGAWDHDAVNQPVPSMGEVVIEGPAEIAHERFGEGELWGVRAAESRARRLMYATRLRTEVARSCDGCCPASDPPNGAQRAAHGGVVRRQDGTVAYGPIWDWSTEDVWQYLAVHDIPVNPVYAKLRAVGAPEVAVRVSHLFDGTRLELGRITWLRRGWPDLYAHLLAQLPRLSEYL